jgi:HK97 gp10 family phage protein
MRITTELISARDADRALRQLPEFARDRVQHVEDVTAFQFARVAAARVRRRSGALARGISWQSRPRSLSAIVGVDPKTGYWKFLEYGTVRQPAYPFARPTAESLAADHDARMIQALNASLTDVSKAQG